MENPTSCSSSYCLVLDDKNENMDISQNVEENKGQQDTSETRDLKIQNPLEMLDVVNLLLKKMEGKTLKSSLMVSKLWNEEGMKLFIKNHYIGIPSKLSLKTKEENQEMIKEFKKLCSKFTLIPNVVINKSRDIHILKDFKILEHVKCVKMNTKSPDVDANIKKVMEKCPNLSFLDVRKYAANSSVVKNSLETGKDGSLTISNLRITFDSPQSYDIMEKFANSGVGVVDLYFDICYAYPVFLLRISSISEKLLHSSKDCLEKMTLQLGWSVLLSIKNIPVMRQLKELSIVFMPNGFFPAPDTLAIFPSGFKFSENCPNLKTCSFTFFLTDEYRLLIDEENFPDMVFATTGPASSVKSLTFFSIVEPIKLDKLCQTFTGIERLSLGPKATDLSSIWEFCHHLKSLNLALTPAVACEQLAQLTGYPLDFITGLWNSSHDLKNLELPPRAPSSILNLQDLESFTIDVSESNETFSKCHKLIYELALRHMPKMKKLQEAA